MTNIQAVTNKLFPIRDRKLSLENIDKLKQYFENYYNELFFGMVCDKNNRPSKLVVFFDSPSAQDNLEDMSNKKHTKAYQNFNSRVKASLSEATSYKVGLLPASTMDSLDKDLRALLKKQEKELNYSNNKKLQAKIEREIVKLHKLTKQK